MPDSPAEDESSLIDAVRNSDSGAFEIVFRKYHATLFRYVWYRCRDAGLAGDIAQDAFVRLWQSRSRLIPRRPLLPLLVTIAGNLLRDQYKHAQIEQKHRDDVLASADPQKDDPDKSVDASLLEERISAIADRYMSDMCRMIFVLSRVEGRDNGEIAELLKISRKAVEDQLYRALKILRKHLPPLE